MGGTVLMASRQSSAVPRLYELPAGAAPETTSEEMLAANREWLRICLTHCVGVWPIPADGPTNLSGGGLNPSRFLFPEHRCKILGRCDHVGSEMTVPSSAALRMRRSRERRRQGDVIVSLDVGPKVTADLGWLPAPDCDKDALTHALIDLIERAIRARVIPSTGSEEGKVCFFSEIKRSTIDTLVELRWLRADQRDDLAAIVTAFRRFVGRWLDIARNGGDVQ
jgi:hypothetical protein